MSETDSSQTSSWLRRKAELLENVSLEKPGDLSAFQIEREQRELQSFVDTAADRLALLRLGNLKELLADVETILRELKADREKRRESGLNEQLIAKMIWKAEEERARLLGLISGLVDVRRPPEPPPRARYSAVDMRRRRPPLSFSIEEPFVAGHSSPRYRYPEPSFEAAFRRPQYDRYDDYFESDEDFYEDSGELLEPVDFDRIRRSIESSFEADVPYQFVTVEEISPELEDRFLEDYEEDSFEEYDEEETLSATDIDLEQESSVEYDDPYDDYDSDELDLEEEEEYDEDEEDDDLDLEAEEAELDQEFAREEVGEVEEDAGVEPIAESPTPEADDDALDLEEDAEEPDADLEDEVDEDLDDEELDEEEELEDEDDDELDLEGEDDELEDEELEGEDEELEDEDDDELDLEGEDDELEDEELEGEDEELEDEDDDELDLEGEDDELDDELDLEGEEDSDEDLEVVGEELKLEDAEDGLDEELALDEDLELDDDDLELDEEELDLGEELDLDEEDLELDDEDLELDADELALLEEEDSDELEAVDVDDEELDEEDEEELDLEGEDEEPEDDDDDEELDLEGEEDSDELEAVELDEEELDLDDDELDLEGEDEELEDEELEDEELEDEELDEELDLEGEEDSDELEAVDVDDEELDLDDEELDLEGEEDELDEEDDDEELDLEGEEDSDELEAVDVDDEELDLDDEELDLEGEEDELDEEDDDEELDLEGEEDSDELEAVDVDDEELDLDDEELDLEGEEDELDEEDDDDLDLEDEEDSDELESVDEDDEDLEEEEESDESEAIQEDDDEALVAAANEASEGDEAEGEVPRPVLLEGKAGDETLSDEDALLGGAPVIDGADDDLFMGVAPGPVEAFEGPDDDTIQVEISSLPTEDEESGESKVADEVVPEDGQVETQEPAATAPLAPGEEEVQKLEPAPAEYRSSILEALKSVQGEGSTREGVLSAMKESLSAASLGASTQERRRLVRLPCEYDVNCFFGNQIFHATIRDISLGGMRLIVSKQVNRGQTLHISNPYRDEDDPDDRVAATVVWFKVSDDGDMQAGLQFSESPENLGRSWVVSLLNKVGMQSKVFNQRKFTRAEANLQVELRLEDESSVTAICLDLGLGGALVACTEDLGEGPFKLAIESFGIHEGLEVGCEVLAKNEDESHGYTYSVRFVELSANQTKLLGRYVVDLLKAGSR